ncbi:MAG: glycosyltransferase family 39 protein [Chloroflexi bacterium]|nr:glycosyltransferase family 39 protein [Chloroflexota bacterium]
MTAASEAANGPSAQPASSARPAIRVGFPPDLALALGLAALALLVRLAFDFRAPPFITNDSSSYLLPGFDLAHGLPFAPILKRPPLYSAFIGGAMRLFGDEPRVLMLLQHLLGVATVVAAFGIGRLVFGRAAGALAGLLTALSGPLLVIEHYLMSETLFMVLLVTGLLVYLYAVRERRLGWLALAALLLGLSALTRPIGQLVFGLLLVALPLLLPRWRLTLQAAGLTIVVFGLTVLPWMLRNQLVQGTFAIAGGSGEGLAVRTIRYEQEFDFRESPGGDPDRLLSRARKIYRDEANDGSAFELARRLREELGVSEIEAERLMRTIALQAIVRKPVYYLQGTAVMVAQTFAGRPVRLKQDWTPWRNIVWDERIAHLLPAATPAEDRSFPTAERLATLYDPARVSLPLAMLLVVGMLSGRSPNRRVALLLGVIVLAVLLAGAALIGIEWRYRYPLDPIVNVLVGGGLVAIARLVARVAPWPIVRTVGSTRRAPARLE